MTTTPCWKVTVHREAERELRAMKIVDPLLAEEVKEVMEVLAHEPDPRRPHNPRLNVCALRETHGEWFRVRTLRGPHARVIFRVLQKRGDRIVEVREFTWLDRGNGEQALQIVHAGTRNIVYRGLASLHKRLKGTA